MLEGLRTLENRIAMGTLAGLKIVLVTNKLPEAYSL